MVPATGPGQNGHRRGPDPEPTAAPAGPQMSPAAAAFLAAYVAARSRYDTRAAGRPTVYTPPRRYNPRRVVVTLADGRVVEKAPASVWETGARLLAEIHAHPDEYVSVQFDFLAPNAP